MTEKRQHVHPDWKPLRRPVRERDVPRQRQPTPVSGGKRNQGLISELEEFGVDVNVNPTEWGLGVVIFGL